MHSHIYTYIYIDIYIYIFRLYTHEVQYFSGSVLSGDFFQAPRLRKRAATWSPWRIWWVWSFLEMTDALTEGDKVINGDCWFFHNSWTFSYVYVWYGSENNKFEETLVLILVIFLAMRNLANSAGCAEDHAQVSHRFIEKKFSGYSYLLLKIPISSCNQEQTTITSPTREYLLRKGSRFKVMFMSIVHCKSLGDITETEDATSTNSKRKCIYWWQEDFPSITTNMSRPQQFFRGWSQQPATLGSLGRPREDRARFFTNLASMSPRAFLSGAESAGSAEPRPSRGWKSGKAIECISVNYDKLSCICL